MGMNKMDIVKMEVRSVLLTAKNGLTLTMFLKEYRCLVGTQFPFREFGYTTDIELLESIPEVVHIKPIRDGEVLLTAVVDKSTEHIFKLVQKQKDSKKSKTTPAAEISKFNETARSGLIKSRPFVPARLKAEIFQILRQNQNGISYSAFTADYHKTFNKSLNLDWLSSEPTERFRKLVLAAPELELKFVGHMEKLCFRSNLQNADSETFKKMIAVQKVGGPQSNTQVSLSNKNQDLTVIPKSIKDNFEKVLKLYPKGIIAAHFPILYYDLFGLDFDLFELGYNSLMALTDDFSDIFYKVKAPNSRNDWLLFHADNAKYAPKIYDSEPNTSDSNLPIKQPLSNRGKSNLHQKKIYQPTEEVSNGIAPISSRYFEPKIPNEAFSTYMPVFISAIANLDHFWFQLQTPKAIAGLCELEADMNTFYYCLPNSNYKMADYDIKVGAACVAFYEEHWFRGVISAISNEETVVVEFVDYGGCEEIPRDGLYYLGKDFLHVPVHAYPAKLAGIKIASKWTRNASLRFIRLCNRLVLMARVHTEVDSTLSILLCDTNGDDDIYINDVLVKEGYAVYSFKKECNDSSDDYSSSESGFLSSSSCSSSTFIEATQNITSPNSVIPRNSYCKREKSNLQKKKSIRRVLLSDNYLTHILLIKNEAYVSVGEMNNLFWNNKNADILIRILKCKKFLLPTISISRDEYRDLFNQMERYSVIDVKECNVTLCLLKHCLKILNVLGHPSESVRKTFIKEIKNFDPNSDVWRESSQESECVIEKVHDEGQKMDRMCQHDLKTMQEGLLCRRHLFMKSFKENGDRDALNRVKEIDTLLINVRRRIKEIEDICNSYSDFLCE